VPHFCLDETSGLGPRDAMCRLGDDSGSASSLTNVYVNLDPWCTAK
jgi:hypothetical protein